MRDWQSQSHVRHYCRYHVVFVPKYRKKQIYGNLRRDIGKILRELCRQQGVEIVEGHAMSDHIHLLLMIPPKHSVAHTVGFLKGKSAIRIFREYLQVKRNFTGRHFWARADAIVRSLKKMTSNSRESACLNPKISDSGKCYQEACI